MLCFAPPSLLQQSFNDKRKKNLFSRKFPFYKNKDQSEQETSDVDRKYVGGERRKEGEVTVSMGLPGLPWEALPRAAAGDRHGLLGGDWLGEPFRPS